MNRLERKRLTLMSGLYVQSMPELPEEALLVVFPLKYQRHESQTSSVMEEEVCHSHQVGSFYVGGRQIVLHRPLWERTDVAFCQTPKVSQGY